MNWYKIVLALAVLSLFITCKKNKSASDNTKYLIFKFKFDPSQVRLNNLGQPSTVPSGHGAQNPMFNKISAHYVELAPNALTQLGSGKVVYMAPETTTGGTKAIDFEKSIVVSENEIFYKVPLKDVAGTYDFIRVSLAYQNYNIAISGAGWTTAGTLASFIGYNSFIKNYTIKDSTVSVNANRLQGYWGFEIENNTWIHGVPTVFQGQAPAGATTVVNPLAATSPIPAGSCVVTGAFSTPLTVTGNETNDIVVTLSLSTNKSFEWTETDGDNLFEPLGADETAGTADDEKVVDMGIRGLIPQVQ